MLAVFRRKHLRDVEWCRCHFRSRSIFFCVKASHGAKLLNGLAMVVIVDPVQAPLGALPTRTAGICIDFGVRKRVWRRNARAGLDARPVESIARRSRFGSPRSKRGPSLSSPSVREFRIPKRFEG
jgi:hypothetical protein